MTTTIIILTTSPGDISCYIAVRDLQLYIELPISISFWSTQKSRSVNLPRYKKENHKKLGFTWNTSNAKSDLKHINNHSKMLSFSRKPNWKNLKYSRNHVSVQIQVLAFSPFHSKPTFLESIFSKPESVIMEVNTRLDINKWTSVWWNRRLRIEEISCFIFSSKAFQFFGILYNVYQGFEKQLNAQWKPRIGQTCQRFMKLAWCIGLYIHDVTQL